MLHISSLKYYIYEWEGGARELFLPLSLILYINIYTVFLQKKQRRTCKFNKKLASVKLLNRKKLMTRNDFKKLVDKVIIPQCLAIMNSKGLSYSGKEDTLANFKRCAKLADTTPQKALFIYACKHWDSISSFIRGEYKDSEKISGRIVDIINYMFLLYALLVEEKGIK